MPIEVIVLANAGFIAIFCALVAVGLAWLTNGDEGAKIVTEELLVRPVRRIEAFFKSVFAME